VVTTPTVAAEYAKAIWTQLQTRNHNVTFMVLDCHEATKTLDQALLICERACEINLDRTGVLVAIGGGVCSDIVTVAASWIRRGIDHIRVPTTLIGQIDAGIGIKGAVNFQGKKSYLGCFYPPAAVVITPAFLRTLPKPYLSAGFAEIIKIAIVKDKRLFERVEHWAQELLEHAFQYPLHVSEEVLWRAIVAMLEELESNLFEDQTYQRLVDFGHTISPALEAASHFTVLHGDAVAMDMAFSTVIAQQRGWLPMATGDRILKLLLAVGLPIWSPSLTVAFCQKSLEEAIYHRGGKLNLVLPTGIGQAMFCEQVDDLSALEMKRAIHTLERVSSSRTPIRILCPLV
jgi:3-dehydroquinate synthase